MENIASQQYPDQYLYLIDYLNSAEFKKSSFISERSKYILISRIIEKKTFSQISKELKLGRGRAGFIFKELIERNVVKIATQKDSLETKVRECKIFLPGRGMRDPYPLEDAGIIRLKDFDDFPASILNRLRNWGPKSTKIVNDYISQFGISIKNDLPEKYSWVFKTEKPILG